jgi:NitT/TauT family transport system permease protein
MSGAKTSGAAVNGGEGSAAEGVSARTAGVDASGAAGKVNGVEDRAASGASAGAGTVRADADADVTGAAGKADAADATAEAAGASGAAPADLTKAAPTQAAPAEPAPTQPAPAKPVPTRKRPRRAPRPLWLNLVALAVGLVAWALLARAGAEGLPGPLSVARRGWALASDGTLESDALASLRRVLIGFGLGTVAAVPIGFLMGWYPIARGLLEPYVQFFRTIPPLALIPLFVVVLGIGEVPKIAVIFLAAFLSSVVAAYQGVVGVDRTLINAARVLGASDRAIFVKVVVPASAPFILVGMRIGLGSAWGTLVAAELIAAQQGLGFRMQQAELYYDLPTIFVGLISIGVLGLVMDRLLLLAERHLTGWQERR